MKSKILNRLRGAEEFVSDSNSVKSSAYQNGSMESNQSA